MDQLMHYREFELIEAATGNDAIRKVRDGHVDLMLLDVGLPDMDGRGGGQDPPARRVQEPDHHADRRTTAIPTRSWARIGRQ